MSDIIEQYNTYVNAMIQVSKDRYTQNQFLMGINALIFAGIGYSVKEKANMNICFILFLAFFGVVLCLIWINLIGKYREYITNKIQVIKEAEGARPELYGFYTEETEKQGIRFKSISMIEEYIPMLFIIFYAMAIIAVISIII